MKRHRPWITAVLGLLFLVQGFAVAAAEHPSFKKGNDVAEQLDHSSMPCAGQMQADPGNASGTASCCDSGCPDMTSCALGHLAVAATATVIAAFAPAAPPTALASEPLTSSPQSLLRPPIAFHG